MKKTKTRIRSSKNKYKKKTKSKKNKKIKQNRARGLAEIFRKKKVIIDQLSQVNIPKDLRINTLRHFSASVIQDKFKEKKINSLLNIFTQREVDTFEVVIDHFINSVNTTYEFDDKKTPGYLLNIKPNAMIASQQIKILSKLKRDPKFLNTMIKRVGYDDLEQTLIFSIQNIRDSFVKILKFKDIAIDDYRGAQLGIETQPLVRNITTRRVDSVIRPPRTTRSQAITRRTRSR